MTSVEIVFRYASEPTEAVLRAAGSLREVYGLRRIVWDRATSTVRVEYDATRLNGAGVERLLRQAGVTVAEEIPAAAPVEETAATTPNA